MAYSEPDFIGDASHSINCTGDAVKGGPGHIEPSYSPSRYGV